jgi:hypothetical protein
MNRLAVLCICLFLQTAATAHLHVSELQERLSALPKAPNGNPLGQFKLQQQLPAAWLGHVRGLGHKRGKEPQLSIRPSVLEAAKQQHQVWYDVRILSCDKYRC